jgi:hypothetical protein
VYAILRTTPDNPRSGVEVPNTGGILLFGRPCIGAAGSPGWRSGGKMVFGNGFGSRAS